MNRLFVLIIATAISFCCYPAMATTAPSGHQIDKKVRLATTDWPPYVGKSMKGLGPLYQVVSRAFKHEGYDIVVDFLSWQDALELDKFHNDGVFPMYAVHDPALACSIPMSGGPVGFYKRKTDPIKFTVDRPGDNQQQAFYDLRKYRFGVVEGYQNTPIFDAATYLKKNQVTSDYENMLQLKDGHVDLIFIDVFVADYLEDQHAPLFDNLEFMGPSLANEHLFLCLSKKAPEYQAKLDAFNKGLQAMRDSGEIEQILDKYGQ